MGNTIATFLDLDKYYENGIGPDPDCRGLTIGGFELAFLANLEGTYIFNKLHPLMEQHVQFIGIYHDDEIINFRGHRSND